MDIVVIMRTCPERWDLYQRTVAAFLAEWGHFPIIHEDTESAAAPAWGTAARHAHITRGFAHMLGIAAHTPCDWLLLLEDDLAFAPGLRAAVEKWPALRDPRCVLGTLYNPRLVTVAPGIADPASFLGAQALLIRPADARFALEKWDTVTGMASKRLATLLSPRGEIRIHSPSLVQHIAPDSAWGARVHTAGDFGKPERSA